MFLLQLATVLHGLVPMFMNITVPAALLRGNALYINILSIFLAPRSYRHRPPLRQASLPMDITEKIKPLNPEVSFQDIRQKLPIILCEYKQQLTPFSFFILLYHKCVQLKMHCTESSREES
jgi:hypothetical protein